MADIPDYDVVEDNIHRLYHEIERLEERERYLGTALEEAIKEHDEKDQRIAELERVATNLRDDMIMRADMGTYDGDHSVQAGNSVWYAFCKALGEDDDN